MDIQLFEYCGILNSIHRHSNYTPQKINLVPEYLFNWNILNVSNQMYTKIYYGTGSKNQVVQH